MSIITTLARLILGRAALSEVIAEFPKEHAKERRRSHRLFRYRSVTFFRLAASAGAWLNRWRAASPPHP